MNKIVTQCPFGKRRSDLAPNLGKGTLPGAGNGLEDLPLALGEIVSNAERRHIAARKEANANRAGNLKELRFRVAGTKTQFNNLLRTPAPALDQPAPIKDFRYQGVSWARKMLLL